MFFRSNRRVPYIDTWSGRHFRILNPRTEDVDIRDIAHALSQTNRYTGHTDFPYSVAQHSYFVSCLCDINFALQGLLHDASEAYLNDISKPVKILSELRRYRKLESRVSDCVMDAFDLPRKEHWSVKWADTYMLKLEFNQLFKNPRAGWWDETPAEINGLKAFDFALQSWSSTEAENIFLTRFEMLTGRKVVRR